MGWYHLEPYENEMPHMKGSDPIHTTLKEMLTLKPYVNIILNSIVQIPTTKTLRNNLFKKSLFKVIWQNKNTGGKKLVLIGKMNF